MAINYREAMPTCVAFIDDLRAAFGAEVINTSISAGIAGKPKFYMSENGHELGSAATLQRSADSFVLDRPALERYCADIEVRQQELIALEQKRRIR